MCRWFSRYPEITRAARLAGYASVAPHPLGFVRTATETNTRDRLFTILNANASPDKLAALFVEGTTLTSDAAIAAALMRSFPPDASDAINPSSGGTNDA